MHVQGVCDCYCVCFCWVSYAGVLRYKWSACLTLACMLTRLLTHRQTLFIVLCAFVSIPECVQKRELLRGKAVHGLLGVAGRPVVLVQHVDLLSMLTGPVLQRLCRLANCSMTFTMRYWCRCIGASCVCVAEPFSHMSWLLWMCC